MLQRLLHRGWCCYIVDESMSNIIQNFMLAYACPVLERKLDKCYMHISH